MCIQTVYVTYYITGILYIDCIDYTNYIIILLLLAIDLPVSIVQR